MALPVPPIGSNTPDELKLPSGYARCEGEGCNLIYFKITPDAKCTTCGGNGRITIPKMLQRDNVDLSPIE